MKTNDYPKISWLESTIKCITSSDLVVTGKAEFDGKTYFDSITDKKNDAIKVKLKEQYAFYFYEQTGPIQLELNFERKENE